MRGQFRFYLPFGELIVPNNILDEGEDAFLRMIARDDQTDVAAAGNFYIGLCGNTFEEVTTLASIADEPTETNGYARKAVTRDSTGWPVLDEVNGIKRISTALLTFTAAGGSFSNAIQRSFLCNAASGAVGKLFSISGALPDPITVVDGQSVPMRYELFLR